MLVINRFLFALFWISFLSCSTLTKKEKSVEIAILDCGHIKVDDVSIFSPGVDQGKKKELADTCYLIKHPKGLLLWDTGLNDSITSTPVRKGPFSMWKTKKLMEQLQELKVSPQDIQFVAFSHMHSDHSGNGNLFTKSKIIMQKEEYKAAFGKDAEKLGFNPAFYGGLKDNKFILLTSDFDLFGDQTVIIKRTLGHTPGHQSLFVKLKAEGPILISGDLYHFTKNYQFKRVPSFNFSKEETLKSMKAMDQFIEKEKATLWIQHDLEQNKTLKHSPYLHW